LDSPEHLIDFVESYSMIDNEANEGGKVLGTELALNKEKKASEQVSRQRSLLLFVLERPWRESSTLTANIFP